MQIKIVCTLRTQNKRVSPTMQNKQKLLTCNANFKPIFFTYIFPFGKMKNGQAYMPNIIITATYVCDQGLIFQKQLSLIFRKHETFNQC